MIIYLYGRNSFFAGLALLFFVMGIISDIIDGLVARLSGRQTKIGSFLDPFADQILIKGLLLIFIIKGDYWLFPLAFFIFRDIIAVIFRWLAAQDELVIKDFFIHTLLSYSQFMIIFLILVNNYLVFQNNVKVPFLISDLVFLFTFIAVILSFISVVCYLGLYFRNLRRARKKDHQAKNTKENGSMIILANKRSRGYKDGYRRHLLHVFAKRRKAPIYFLSEKANLFDNLSEQIKKADQIIIAGGDGTFESALNNPLLQKKSLGFFPLGAGNAYYSYFYKGKRFEYLRSRFPFYEIKLDLLELSWLGRKKLTTFLTVGIDSEVMRLSSRRTQNGFFDYIYGCWKTIWNSRSGGSIRCIVDKKEYFWPNCINLALGKIPYYGFSLRSLLNKVHPGDRLVYGLAVINTHSAILNKSLRLWALILSALGINKSPLFPLAGKKIIVSSDKEFPLQAGGEFLGYTSKISVMVKRSQKMLVI